MVVRDERAAAQVNAAGLTRLAVDPFGRPETGWAFYAPLVQRDIRARCAPDSAGFAVYGRPNPGNLKFTLRGGDQTTLPARLGARRAARERGEPAALPLCLSADHRIHAAGGRRCAR